MRLRNLVPLLALFLLSVGPVAGQGVSQESANKYNEGQGLYEKHRYAEAAKAFQDAVKLDAKNAQAYRALGRTYQSLRDFNKAIDAYKMATSVKPDYAAAFFELGELQAKALHNFKDSQDSFKKVLAIDPKFQNGKAKEDLQKVYMAQGNVYFKRKNYKQAAEEYSNATQLDPTDASSFYNLGLAYRGTRDYNNAEQAFSTAVDIDENYGKAHRALGDLYTDINQNSKAVSAYLKAIKADPKDTRSRLNLAITYQKLNQNDKAIDALQRAIEVDPKDSEIFNALGKAYADEKKFKEALESYKKALVIKDDPEYHYRSAVAYVELKQYQSAISSAQKAVSDTKWRVPANVVLGDAYLGLDQKDKAVEHYKIGASDRIYKKYCEDQIDRILNPMGGGEGQ